MKELDLGKEKISKLLIIFSIPCVVSMLINAIYNIVDQIFIGQGVGILGNAATNVIFPIVIICTALAQLIGNGCAAGLSLKLGEGKKDEAKKSVGSAISTLILLSIVFSALAYVLLPKIVYLFGCTDTVYPYAIKYGRWILLGAPFMIIYTGLTAIIRSDGSPKYSMICLVIGCVINLILDPLFIFTFKMGVAGGAIATVLGQVVSCLIALAYIPKTKSIKLEKKDFKIDKSIFKTMSYGVSSFLTQLIVLILIVFMNNVMTKYGAMSEFGPDIPLSIYGIVSKLNNIYISTVLGIAIGSQPILGFNYGAGNYDRVKETLKDVLIVNFIVGIIFNIAFVVFPKELVSIFGGGDNKLYLRFATDCCRYFLLVCAFNALELTSANVIQSLGKVKKATAVVFIRQIVLFIPIALVMAHYMGLYGALYAGPIADTICFVIVCFIFGDEYKKLGKKKSTSYTLKDSTNSSNALNGKVIITINREYGSGGRYVGKMIAEQLGIKFYDKELVELASKESGLSEEFIEENEQKRDWGSNLNYYYNNDDKIFESESKIIKSLAKKDSCVIIGRCADYILKDEKNIVKIFIYSSEKDKIDRAVKYYGMKKQDALKEINHVNKLRAKHYKYYTNREWRDPLNYDLTINSDYLGTEKTAEMISELVREKFND